jgi:hypothetical protein
VQHSLYVSQAAQISSLLDWHPKIKSNQQQQQQQITTNIRIAKTGKQNMTHGCALSL